MIAADERRARARPGGVLWTEDPERFDVFARLPAVMRLLRMEAGESPEQLDTRLGLPRGSYTAYEWALTAPLLGTLDRFLVLFELDLSNLEEKLRAMQKIEWPSTDVQDDKEPDVDIEWPAAEDFAQAHEVMRGFEELSQDRPAPPEHPFESFAETLAWLRAFFRLSRRELAGFTGLSVSTIRGLEVGGRSPQRDTCYLIGRRLQTLFNQKLICAGHRGIRAFWEPPRE